MIEMYNEKSERKMKFEHLEKCMNCKLFLGCSQGKKEDTEDCGKFKEQNSDRQVVIIDLKEYMKLKKLEKEAEP
jgi:hypothetical protein